MAFYSVPLGPGDRILTSSSEYASNYIAYLQRAAHTGATVETIPTDEHGQVDVDRLRDTIDDRVRLIGITHVPTNGGLVNPAAEIGAIAREAGCLYLLDACQSVGQLAIDVREIGCHLLSGTGRKYLRGPRGTGFLYVDAETIPTLEPPFLDLHAAAWVARDRFTVRDDARRFENWETNVAAKIGLGVAARYALGWGLPAIEQRVVDLAARLRTGLQSIDGVRVRDLGVRQCGIVTFTSDTHRADTIRRHLAGAGINVWVSVQEYARLDMEARDLDELVRASVHYFNTEAEVDRFVQVVSSVVT